MWTGGGGGRSRDQLRVNGGEARTVAIVHCASLAWFGSQCEAIVLKVRKKKEKKEISKWLERIK